MKTKVLAVVALLAGVTNASAGTQLQLQLREWVRAGDTTVKVLATLRNPTLKRFAEVIWACDLFDKDAKIVGHSPFIFHVVPWGAVLVDTQYLYANGGTFATATCTLAKAERVNSENERLYRPSSMSLAIGLGDRNSDNWFSFKMPIQGRAVVSSDEEETELRRQGQH